MPILFSTLISLGLAWVRGAPPTRLASIRLRWLAMPIVAFLIQAAIFVRFEDALQSVAPWLHLVSLVMLLVFLLANLYYRTLAIVALGVVLNLAVIAANGGYMPVRIADVHGAGFADIAEHLERRGRFQKSTPLTGSTPLPWLADVIPLPLPGPDRLISLGDIFVAIGAFLFVQEALVTPTRRPVSRSLVAGSSLPSPQ